MNKNREMETIRKERNLGGAKPRPDSMDRALKKEEDKMVGGSEFFWKG